MTSPDPITVPAQPSDPTLFAPLTIEENNLLCAYLASAWSKQSATCPAWSGPWLETGGLLDDLHQAHQGRLEARAAASAQNGLAEPEPEAGA